MAIPISGSTSSVPRDSSDLIAKEFSEAMAARRAALHAGVGVGKSSDKAKDSFFSDSSDKNSYSNLDPKAKLKTLSELVGDPNFPHEHDCEVWSYHDCDYSDLR